MGYSNIDRVIVFVHVYACVCVWVVQYCMYVCMVITYSRVWINRVRLPILLMVS